MGSSNPFRIKSFTRFLEDAAHDGLKSSMLGEWHDDHVLKKRQNARKKANEQIAAVEQERKTEERRVQKEKDDAMMTEQDRIKRNRTVFSSRKNRRRQGYGGMLRKKLGSD